MAEPHAHPGSHHHHVSFADVLQQHAITPGHEVDNVKKLLLRLPKEARFVLLGGDTHGTHEWQVLRAELSKRLIQDLGYHAVAIEADFPDAFRVNMFIRGLDPDYQTPTASLRDFQKFPQWVWGNDEFDHFVGWLEGFNRGNKAFGNMDKAGGIGLYGMDLYSRNASAHAVIKYLDQVDAAAAERARRRYACFDRFGSDAVSYAFKSAQGEASCSDAAMEVLMDLLRKRGVYERKADGGVEAAERTFAALTNARAVKDAEEYYRLMFFNKEADTWNIRVGHMFETLQSIEDHLRTDYHIAKPKIVVWAHNSHVCAARGSDMGHKRGEVNLGQLMRQQYGQEAYSIGFLTHQGTVAAAEEWGEPVKAQVLPPAPPGSYQRLFHDTGLPSLALDLRNAAPELQAALAGPRKQRHVGVIYEPNANPASYFSQAWLPEQYDMVVHVDTTHALAPLDKRPAGEGLEDQSGKLPETYPFGV